MKFSGKFASVAVFAAFGVAAMAVADIGPFSSIRRIVRTSNSLTQGVVGVAEPVVTLEIFNTVGGPNLAADPDGVYRINLGKIEAKVNVTARRTGKVTFSLGGRAIKTADLTGSGTIAELIDLSSIENLGATRLKAVVKYDDIKLSESSGEIELDVDTEGPILTRVRLAGDPGAHPVGMILTFQDDDLNESTVEHTHFEVARAGAGGSYTAMADGNAGVIEATMKGAVVTLKLRGPLPIGKYRVTAETSLLDKRGNPAGQIKLGVTKKQQLEFTPTVYGPTGPAIHFPQFTQRERLNPNANFNPGDHVETRVVRLYYNRDAHRVAQIINRDIRQLNKAGVDDARRMATEARRVADDAQDKREREEENATEVAKQLRTMERQLTVKQQAAERARNKLAQVKALQQQLAALGPDSGVNTEPFASPSSIANATISNATITGANIQPSSVAGEDTKGRVTTNGTLRTGTLVSGQFKSPGSIVWDVSGEPEFDGKVVYRYRGTITGGSLAPASLPAVSGGSIMGQTTGGATNNATLSGSFVQDADIQGAMLSMLTKETINQNQVQIDAIKSELKIQTGSQDPQTGGATTLVQAVTTAENAVTEMESKIAEQQIAISEAKKKVSQSEREERLANRTQFEAEVASGTADPDSYAPADLSSIDPVMQVSMSVIGEGVIQLRGPIRGINEIRTMINQIDSPLGQVKVGLFTIQINGEEGDKMDEVAARLEGYIDLSRFLTNHSLQLLRRAVQEEAGQVASEIVEQYPQHRQIDRDRLYVYSFFGRHFIDELYEMDSEFLRTENKLLSLHAMDTVSMSQATFIIALAKNDIRQRILGRFLYLVQTELPQAEYDQRRTAGMLKKSRDINAFRRLISIPGFPKDPERKLAKYSDKEMQKYCRKAHEIYKFQNFINFMTADVSGPDVMTPIQREFIRLAQIFKSQMIAEMELKQRVIERALLQDAGGNEEQHRREAREQHEDSLKSLKVAHRNQAIQAANVRDAIHGKLMGKIRGLEASNLAMKDGIATIGATELVVFMGRGKTKIKLFLTDNGPTPFHVETGDGRTLTLTFDLAERAEAPVVPADPPVEPAGTNDKKLCEDYRVNNGDSKNMHEYGIHLEVLVDGAPEGENDTALKTFLQKVTKFAEGKYDVFSGYVLSVDNKEIVDEEICYIQRLRGGLIELSFADKDTRVDTIAKACRSVDDLDTVTGAVLIKAAAIRSRVDGLLTLLSVDFDGLDANDRLDEANSAFGQLKRMVLPQVKGKLNGEVRSLFREVDNSLSELRVSISQSLTARVDERSSRLDLDHKKLLDYLIDEKEEKYIELVEGTRSHIAQMDNYLKRLAIALEDDFKVQFYDPAFEGVRAEGRDKSVSLGQIERTTILTNNRTFAKVSPQASMEFDLPKRAPVIVEAMSGAKALMQDYGDLVNDPAFVGLTGALSGSPPVGGASTGGPPQVKPLFPTQGTDSQSSFLSGGPPGTPGGRQKTSLEQLIPDPAVYKIQTGTGFEIRPVIQPDGHSIMYDFNYLYTTNVREPVDPDEKHLGRIKQHYIHTQVQTSSFELREISRYQVALKVSRTSRGVPLLEDIPLAGPLFKPAPSAESSLQQNIILGQTTVYPTLFDLMGLRWSKYVADLDHTQLRDLEHVVRGRNKSLNDYVFDRASQQVDKFLDIEHKGEEHYRPDMYHQQTQPSPYHPGGYTYSTEKDGQEITDPTGQNFYRRDRRPEEFRQPPYDELRRGPIENYSTGRESFPPTVVPLEQIQTPGPAPLEQIPPASALLEPIPAPLPDYESASSRSTTHRGNIRLAGFEQEQAREKMVPEVRPTQTLSNGGTPVPKRSRLIDRILRR